MKFKGTWILMGSVVALALYAYFGEYKKEIDDQKNKEVQTSLFKTSVDQISSLTLQTEKEKIILTKTIDGWTLESPLKDSADNEAVESLVSSLAQDKYSEVVKEGSDISWSEYGLDKPVAELIVKNTMGQETKVEISPKKNFEGNSLLRLNGENRVLLAPGVWSVRAVKTAFEFRDRRLLRNKVASVDSLSLKNQKGNLSLLQKDGVWGLDGQPQTKLDQNKVREILSAVGEAKASGFEVEHNSWKPTDLKKYGLDHPWIQLTAGLKEKKWNLQIGKNDKNLIFGLVSEPAMIVRLDSATLDKFTAASLNHIRDRGFLFDLGKNAIQELNLKSPVKKMNLKQVGGVWSLNPPSPDVEVNQEQMKNFFESLKKSQAFSFAAGVKSLKPDFQLSLKNEKNETSLEITWEEIKKTKIDGTEVSVHLAQSNLSSELFYLEDSTIDSWKLQELTQDKPKVEKK